MVRAQLMDSSSTYSCHKVSTSHWFHYRSIKILYAWYITKDIHIPTYRRIISRSHPHETIGSSIITRIKLHVYVINHLPLTSPILFWVGRGGGGQKNDSAPKIATVSWLLLLIGCPSPSPPPPPLHPHPFGVRWAPGQTTTSRQWFSLTFMVGWT